MSCQFLVINGLCFDLETINKVLKCVRNGHLKDHIRPRLFTNDIIWTKLTDGSF